MRIQRLGHFAITGERTDISPYSVYDGVDPATGTTVRIRAVPLALSGGHGAHDERFQAAARVAATVHDPRLVVPVGSGTAETPAGTLLYVVTIPPPGLSLADRLADTITVAQALAITADVLAGLEAIHRAGLSHGGIRAEVVFVTAAGRALLDGFSLAPAHHIRGLDMGTAADRVGDLAAVTALLSRMLKTVTEPLPAGLDPILTVGRFPTAAAFADAVTMVAAGAGPAPAPVGQEQARGRGQAIVAGLAVAALLAAGGGWYLTRPVPAPLLSVLPAPAVVPVPAVPAPPAAPVTIIPPVPPEQVPPEQVPPEERRPADPPPVAPEALPVPSPAPPAAPPAEAPPVEAPPVAAPPPEPPRAEESRAEEPRPEEPQAETPPAAALVPEPPAIPTIEAPQPSIPEPEPVPTPGPPPDQAPVPAPEPAPFPAPPPAVVDVEAPPEPTAPEPTAPAPATTEPAAAEPATAEPPAVVEQAAPAPAAPSLAEHRDRLTQALDHGVCGLVSVTDSDGGLVVSGTVAGEAERERVLGLLDSVPAPLRRTPALTVAAAAFCAPLQAIAAARVASETPGLRVPDGAVFTGGEDLTLELLAPEVTAHIQVDYFTLEGTVVHLLPNPLEADVRMGGGSHRLLGERRDNARYWEVAPPYGTELVVLIASPIPLFPTAPKAEVEAADTYAVTLREALSATPGAMAVPLFITTRAPADTKP